MVIPPRPANSIIRNGEAKPRAIARRYSWINAERKRVEIIAGNLEEKMAHKSRKRYE